MTEEINNLNTDLKELFINSNFDGMKEILEETTDAIVLELALFNYEIIKKYYDSQKYDILFQHIKFVAFSSYLGDYSHQRQLIDENVYESMSQIFDSIYLLIKKKEN
jgi:hypothetical protein